MRLLALAALLASTCFTPPKESPEPTTDPVGYPVEDAGSDDAGTPTPQPSDPCEALFAQLDSNECAPSDGHALWLERCAHLSAAQLACAMSKDICGEAYACLESK